MAPRLVARTTQQRNDRVMWRRRRSNRRRPSASPPWARFVLGLVALLGAVAGSSELASAAPGAERPAARVAGPETAAPTPGVPAQLLADARALDRAGASSDALDRFEELAARFPDAPESAEAHYQAARLRQRRLGDLTGALLHLRALEQRFPDSRWAAGVPDRVAILEAALASGATSLARYEAIMQRHTRSEASETDTANALAELLRADPDFPLAPRALLFVARVQRHAGDRAAAERLYREVRARFTERVEAFEAGKAIGDMRFDRSDFRGAIAAWGSLFPVQSAEQAITLEGLVARAEGHLRRQVVASACAAYLGLALVAAAVLVRRPRALVRAARASLREVGVLVPPLVLLVWLAYPNTIVTYFLASFTMAVVPVVMLHVACIESGRIRRRTAPLYAAGVSAALASVTYLLLYAFDLAFVLERPLRWVSA